MAMTGMTAAREWANRPDDQRYLSLEELQRAAVSDRDACRTAVKRNADLTVLAGLDGGLLVNGGKRDAGFTNWSFSQFCGLFGAPTRYISSLPADLAARCLNHGIKTLKEETRRDEHQILIRTYPDSDRQTLRAITSTSYTRVWDAPLVDTIRRFTDNENGKAGWAVPPSWPGKTKPGGLYRSDRDLFLYMTNGGSIVTDPTLRGTYGRTPGAPDGGDQMYRGFIARNSEVGSASLSISTFLFRWTCGNHIIGGLTDVKEYKRRHVGAGLTYLADEALRHVARWIDTPASRDEALIAQLASYEIGKTKEDVIAALRGRHGFTESQATAAYESAEQHEPGSPRTAWTIAQGVTRISQGAAGDPTHNDARFSLDQLAGAMLARIGRLVAA